MDQWANGWSRFTGGRFGTVTEVPENLFDRGKPTADGRRRTFRSKGDDADSRSSELRERSAPRERLLAQAERDGVHVTYKADRNDWFVLSGLEGADRRTITYTKVVKGCGAVHGIKIGYPDSKRDFYDPVAIRLAEAMTCRTAARVRR